MTLVKRIGFSSLINISRNVNKVSVNVEQARNFLLDTGVLYRHTLM